MIRPKLRKLDRYTLHRDEEELLVLQDPHRLDDPLAVDPAIADYLDMMDGKRTVAQLRQSMIMRGRPALPLDELQAVVDTLQACGFLEDDLFRARWASALREFQEASHLTASLAGMAYPDDPAWLRQNFKSLIARPTHPTHSALAVIWPYGPYPFLSENTMASAVMRHLPAPEDLDGILLLTTSHHDGTLPYQLLDKHYQTLLGPLDHPSTIVQALLRNRPWLTGEPMRWKGEQSLEVSLLALRARYHDRCPPVLSLMCGRACFSTKQDEAQVLQSASLLAQLGNLLDTGRWLAIASAQLGHLEPGQQSNIDQGLVTALQHKRERAFFPSVLGKIPSQQRPVGAPVLATFLSLLPANWRCRYAAHERRIPLDGQGSIGHAYLHYGP